MVRHSSTLAGLGYVYCVPEHRGKGLARHLIEYVLKEKQTPGMVVGLDAVESAHKMYEKFGFQSASILQRFQGVAKQQTVEDGELKFEELSDEKVTKELLIFDRRVNFFDTTKYFENMFKI